MKIQLITLFAFFSAFAFGSLATAEIPNPYTCTKTISLCENSVLNYTGVPIVKTFTHCGDYLNNDIIESSYENGLQEHAFNCKIQSSETYDAVQGTTKPFEPIDD